MDGKELGRLYSIVLIVVFGILAFFLIRPILLSILAGLILAYIFFPVYNWINKRIKIKGISAFIVSLLVLAIIVVPLWFVVPLIVQQVFEVFRATQTLNVQGFVANLFPTASQEFVTQTTVALNNIISKISSTVLNSLVNFFLNSVTLLLNLFIIFFVFYYSLKDSDKLKRLVRDISPLSKQKEKVISSKFKAITNSLIYGQIIAGLVQGAAAAIGLYLFGVPGALILSLVAIILAIIPIIGPALVWIPVAIYLILTGNLGLAIGFVVYNLAIVSTIDNIIRSHIVSRRIRLSPAIVLVGMIGGLFIFGLLGLILGPLILTYFITFLQSYREEKDFVVFESTKKTAKRFFSLLKK